MKRIYFIILFFCISSISLAKNPNVMLGADLGYYIPTGLSKYQSNVGFQGQIEFRIASYIGIDIAICYFQIQYNSDSFSKTIDIIPIVIGTRFYWYEKGISPYTCLDFVVSNFNNKYKYDFEKNYTDTKLGYSIIQGILIPLSNNFFINSNFILTRISGEYTSYDYIVINTGVSVIL